MLRFCGAAGRQATGVNHRLSVFVEVAVCQPVHCSVTRHSKTIGLNVNEKKGWLWRANLCDDPDTILVDSPIRRKRPHLATKWNIGNAGFRQGTQLVKRQRSQPL
jgi:hypothetical protein